MIYLNFINSYDFVLIPVEYFKKIECFCFNQQTIDSGEVKDLGIQFVVDNDLPTNIGDIVLSYTMFDITNKVVEADKL